MTERVRGDLQRRQLESKLFQLQKLESLGAMAGGVAHDFNNMIGIVMASAELAMLQLDADHPSRTLFEESLAATQKAAALTKQLLAYAGRGVASVEPKPLLAPVREACDLLERALPERITLHRELPETLAASEMDATQIQQVLMNLIMNSQEAIGDEAGRIEVQVGERVLDEADTRRLIGSELRARDRCVYVQVSDDGPGMNAEVLDRIFDPFFTTKSDGHGLGLAALLGIVLAHRGGVEVESRPGQGTRFRILLPVCDDASEASMVDDGLRGEGLVLVVDDERVMREIACKVLSHYGYETMMAENGRQALDLVAKHAGEISLVLLDIQMPGLMGHEVFPLLRGIRPDLPVILSSAFGEYEKVSHLAREPRSAFLAKPYGARDLARMLRSVLDSEGAGQA